MSGGLAVWDMDHPARQRKGICMACREAAVQVSFVYIGCLVRPEV